MTRWLPWLWLLVPGGSLVLLFLWIRHHYQSEGVSSQWLREHAQRDGRGFEGVSMQFPIKKLLNDASAYQTVKLRNEVAQSYLGKVKSHV